MSCAHRSSCLRPGRAARRRTERAASAMTAAASSTNAASTTSHGPPRDRERRRDRGGRAGDRGVREFARGDEGGHDADDASDDDRGADRDGEFGGSRRATACARVRRARAARRPRRTVPSRARSRAPTSAISARASAPAHPTHNAVTAGPMRVADDTSARVVADSAERRSASSVLATRSGSEVASHRSPNCGTPPPSSKAARLERARGRRSTAFVPPWARTGTVPATIASSSAPPVTTRKANRSPTSAEMRVGELVAEHHGQRVTAPGRQSRAGLGFGRRDHDRAVDGELGRDARRRAMASSSTRTSSAPEAPTSDACRPMRRSPAASGSSVSTMPPPAAMSTSPAGSRVAAPPEVSSQADTATRARGAGRSLHGDVDAEGRRRLREVRRPPPRPTPRAGRRPRRRRCPARPARARRPVRRRGSRDRNRCGSRRGRRGRRRVIPSTLGERVGEGERVGAAHEVAARERHAHVAAGRERRHLAVDGLPRARERRGEGEAGDREHRHERRRRVERGASGELAHRQRGHQGGARGGEPFEQRHRPARSARARASDRASSTSTGASTAIGSTSTRPDALVTSGDPYSRNCQSAIAAATAISSAPPATAVRGTRPTSSPEPRTTGRRASMKARPATIATAATRATDAASQAMAPVACLAGAGERQHGLGGEHADDRGRHADDEHLDGGLARETRGRGAAGAEQGRLGAPGRAEQRREPGERGEAGERQHEHGERGDRAHGADAGEQARERGAEVARRAESARADFGLVAQRGLDVREGRAQRRGAFGRQLGGVGHGGPAHDDRGRDIRQRVLVDDERSGAVVDRARSRRSARRTRPGRSGRSAATCRRPAAVRARRRRAVTRSPGASPSSAAAPACRVAGRRSPRRPRRATRGVGPVAVDEFGAVGEPGIGEQHRAERRRRSAVAATGAVSTLRLQVAPFGTIMRSSTDAAASDCASASSARRICQRVAPSAPVVAARPARRPPVAAPARESTTAVPRPVSSMTTAAMPASTPRRAFARANAVRAAPTRALLVDRVARAGECRGRARGPASMRGGHARPT